MYWNTYHRTRYPDFMTGNTQPESHAKKRFSGKFRSVSADVISSSPVLPYLSTQKSYSSPSLAVSLSLSLALFHSYCHIRFA